jgi:hypothetical protein
MILATSTARVFSASKENGGFLDTPKIPVVDYPKPNCQVNILVQFSTSRLCQ